MAFTEFYCDAANGSNLNAGSESGGAARLTYASGSWVASTGVFTAASGNPNTDGVVVGDFASVYPDGASVAVFIGRVTAKDATTITVSLTAKSGTAPTDGTSNRTLKIGGTWKGPNAAESFPLDFINTAMNNGTNVVPRVNFKNNASYVASGALTASASTVVFQGYTTTPGDGGMATIDGGTGGSAYNLVAVTGANILFKNIKFYQNGGSGGSVSTHGVNVTGARNVLHQCVCAGMRGSGFYVATPALLLECEAYDCNRNNSTAKGAIHLLSSGAIAIRCYSHHNAGSNGNGYYADTTVSFIGCVAHSNGKDGWYANSDQFLTLIGCEAYNNTGSGLDSQGGSGTLNFNVQSCNFVKNGRYGIECSATTRYGVIYNCGFGAGTQANSLGQITANISPVGISGSVTYPNDVTPWADPANGDFRIVLPEAKAAGRGSYLQTYGESAPNTVGYPDIGACQSKPGTRVS